MHLGDHHSVHCQEGVEETTTHLLFYCPFASACWELLNFHFTEDLSIPHLFQEWKLLIQTEFSLELFILIC